MPISWKDGTADRKLLRLVLRGIKPGNLDGLAKEMGGGCTGKALSHRIANLKGDASIESIDLPTTPPRARGPTFDPSSTTPTGARRSNTIQAGSPQTPITPRSGNRKRSFKTMSESSSDGPDITDFSALDSSSGESCEPPRKAKKQAVTDTARAARTKAGDDAEQEIKDTINEDTIKEESDTDSF